MMQVKQKEITFFSNIARSGSYNVFSPESSLKIVNKLIETARFKKTDFILDLGCGSGVFTNIFYSLGFKNIHGLDLCESLIQQGKQYYPDIVFQVADIEHLPYGDNSVDGIVFSAVIHHFPDPNLAFKEAYRVLKPGGKFIAFDPNRCNPFMWLYRDKASPFYSSCGVTENERPVLASQLRKVIESVGFETKFDYLSGLKYVYVKSKMAVNFLPVYNFLDTLIFDNNLFKIFSAFLITLGCKK